MNILFLADPLSIHDVRWINYLALEKGNRCFIVTRNSHYKAFASSDNSLGLSVKVVGSIADPSSVRPWRNFIEARKILRIIVQYKIDILHVLYAEPNALWARWKATFQIPIIITTRGSDILKTIPLFFQQKTIFHRVIASQYKQAFLAADAVTCTSMVQAEIVSRLMSVRCEVVRTGIDVLKIDNSNADIAGHLKINKPFVLMPRNMKPIYNHELTIAAIGMLRSDIVGKYAFVFLNSDTKNQAYFRFIKNEATMVSADIRFYPTLPHSSLLSLYKQASLVVMNPLSDGTPVSALESMASGTPVVMPELSYDGDIFNFAYFFNPPTSPVSLKEKIEFALEGRSSVFNAEMVEFVKSKADSVTEMSKIHLLYHALLNGSSR